MTIEEDFGRVRSLVEVATDDEVVAAVETLKRRVSELEPQATDGRAYRADLIAEALAEGVRAQGKDFDQPTYEAMLTTAPLATIKRMRDDWQRIGSERLQGGRRSVDESQAPDKQAKPVSHVPASAFSA